MSISLDDKEMCVVSKLKTTMDAVVEQKIPVPFAVTRLLNPPANQHQTIILVEDQTQRRVRLTVTPMLLSMSGFFQKLFTFPASVVEIPELPVPTLEDGLHLLALLHCQGNEFYTLCQKATLNVSTIKLCIYWDLTLALSVQQRISYWLQSVVKANKNTIQLIDAGQIERVLALITHAQPQIHLVHLFVQALADNKLFEYSICIGIELALSALKDVDPVVLNQLVVNLSANVCAYNRSTEYQQPPDVSAQDVKLSDAAIGTGPDQKLANTEQKQKPIQAATLFLLRACLLWRASVYEALLSNTLQQLFLDLSRCDGLLIPKELLHYFRVRIPKARRVPELDYLVASSTLSFTPNQQKPQPIPELCVLVNFERTGWNTYDDEWEIKIANIFTINHLKSHITKYHDSIESQKPWVCALLVQNSKSIVVTQQLEPHVWGLATQIILFQQVFYSTV